MYTLYSTFFHVVCTRYLHKSLGVFVEERKENILKLSLETHVWMKLIYCMWLSRTVQAPAWVYEQLVSVHNKTHHDAVSIIEAKTWTSLWTRT